MKTYDDLVTLFEKTNSIFINENLDLFHIRVSERTLCGALMLSIHEMLRKDKTYTGYHVDIEYNRRQDEIKVGTKTIKGPKNEEILINCDLIVHGRGRQM
ncbi:MAG: hypothetical protein Q4G59_12405 [Planctomycetia bacterium]|nr:hypothetical protein [Planctomycetia bacterium]